MRGSGNAKLLAADGGMVVGGTPGEFAAFIKKDIDKWAQPGRTFKLTRE